MAHPSLGVPCQSPADLAEENGGPHGKKRQPESQPSRGFNGSAQKHHGDSASSRRSSVRLRQDPAGVAKEHKGLHGKKRKLEPQPPQASAAPSFLPAKKQKQKQTGNEPDAEEKRLRRFRPNPPQAWHEVYNRALSQRFYVLQRERTGTVEAPEENVEMAGSTGNIYNVHIGKLPTCNCPHAKKGNECKHVLYIMSQVLHAPYNLVYQRALVSSELRTIFAAAPPIPGTGSSVGEASNEKRKKVEGDCPICFLELKVDSPESITWCQATCGQNMHTECFGVWASSKGSNVTCPMCRSVWKEDEASLAKKINKAQGHRSEGYLNIGRQLGLSSTRDESTYSPWYRRMNRP